MIPEPSQRERLKYLLGKSRLEAISKSEERELRNILTQVVPHSEELGPDELIYRGLLLVGAESHQENPTLIRLEEQIHWYDQKSILNQSYFKRIKIIEITTAVLIIFLAGISTSIFNYAIIIGSLGALIVVLESLLGLYQFQRNWLSYRITCEALKYEKYLWQAQAGHYADAKDPGLLLAERVESLVSNEHGMWIPAPGKSR